jgi:general stress protein 26
MIVIDRNSIGTSGGVAAEGTPHALIEGMAEMSKKVEELKKLIEGIETAMLTTRRADGHLVSRPMAVQNGLENGELCFVTDVETHKMDELRLDPHVNCSFYRDRTREWVSVSGVARVSRDRARIRKLHDPSWRAWFGDEGGDRDGGPDDPRIALILVEPLSVTFMKQNKPRPVVLFEVVKGMVTGKATDVGDIKTVSGGELMD